jgi:hypothetical protein
MLTGVPIVAGSPSDLAAKTARWATTMTRWAIRFASSGERAGTSVSKRWQFVGFAGPNGSESRGIVDLMAIRRDHLTTDNNFRIGDLFEIVFVQIKGGGAPWPTFDDVKRLLAVRRYYRAKAVVLASWKKGAEPTFYVLKRLSADRNVTWSETAAVTIFGTQRRRLAPKARSPRRSPVPDR